MMQARPASTRWTSAWTRAQSGAAATSSGPMPCTRVASGGMGLRGFTRVSVSDDGEGIPGRSLPRIFERFYRADSSRARDFGGTGLGLAIVKHLVSSMGGDIEAESELGHGATIRFTVPSASP